MARIAVGIQARLGSTRFPGKSIALLQGEPLIHWVLRGVSRSQLVDEVVVLTTTKAQDDELVDAIGDRATVLRGHPDNVQSRFTHLIEQTHCSHVVRITADCPLVDGHLLDDLVRKGTEEQAEYSHILAQAYYEQAFPNGLNGEYFSVAAFEKMKRLGTDTRHHEHVTLAVDEFPTEFNIGRLTPPPEWSRPGIKLSVDTRADLEQIQQVVRILGPHARDASVGDIIQAIDQLPGTERSVA